MLRRARAELLFSLPRPYNPLLPASPVYRRVYTYRYIYIGYRGPALRKKRKERKKSCRSTYLVFIFDFYFFFSSSSSYSSCPVICRRRAKTDLCDVFIRSSRRRRRKLLTTGEVYRAHRLQLQQLGGMIQEIRGWYSIALEKTTLFWDTFRLAATSPQMDFPRPDLFFFSSLRKYQETNISPLMILNCTNEEWNNTPTVKIFKRERENKKRTSIYRQAENEDITELLGGEKGYTRDEGLDVITGRQRFLSLIFCFPVWFGCPFVLVLSEDSIGFIFSFYFSDQSIVVVVVVVGGTNYIFGRFLR